MSGRIVASAQSCSFCPSPATIHRRGCAVVPRVSRDLPKLLSPGLHSSPRINLKCRCNGGSENNETRTVLDAFFLGKALAEAFSERLESAVGEFLSTIGRLEAEQQKQIQEFQEEVVEKARRAKEQAAREALMEKGLILKSTTPQETKINGVTTTTSSDAYDSDNNDATSSMSKPNIEEQEEEEDPSSEIPDED